MNAPHGIPEPGAASQTAGTSPASTQAATAPAHTAPLLSPHWFRVSALRPQLSAALQTVRMVQRGQVWFVLCLPGGNRSQRLNASAWRMVARSNGQRSVQQLWDAALADLGDHAPTQADWMQMLARLHGAGLLSFDRKPDFGQLQTQSGPANAGAEFSPAHRPQSLLAWRVPLGNPNALLALWLRRLGFMLGAPACALWLLVVAWGALTALQQAGPLRAQLGPLLQAPSSWGMAWVAYPVIKFLHEAAHGLVARRFGAAVPSWGFTLLMFVPVPYVDASAASALPQRWQRFAVAGAGIMAEMAVASGALAVAMNLQAGPWRNAALLVFFMAALSTLLVNANPLMRFDGYHMLCDALNLPNLATRSKLFWRQRLRSAFSAALQPGPAQSDVGSAQVQPAAGERPWLLAYAPAAAVMGWSVAWAVVAWLGGLSALLGWLAAALFAFGLVVKPLWAGALWMHQNAWPAHAGAGTPRRAVVLVVALALPLLVLLWPMPVTSVAQGVVGLPEHALVRNQTAGLVAQVLVADGQTVAAGDTVMQLLAPNAQAQAERLQGHVQGLLAEQAQALRNDPAAAVQTEHALQTALAELALVEERVSQLSVKAPSSGRVVIEHPADWPGRHVQRGSLLATVITGEPGLVRFALPHEQAARLLGQEPTGNSVNATTNEAKTAAPQRVQVYSADPWAPTRWAQWSGQASGGLTQLPDKALGDRSGGRIATDPADPSGLRTAQAVVVGEVQLLGGGAKQLGERVLLRFEHGHAPLLWQAARALQQQVLRHFSPKLNPNPVISP